MKKRKRKELLVAKEMPPLYHTVPGQSFNIFKSEVFNWLSKRPSLISYLFDVLKSNGYISYDPNTGKWQGVDYEPEDN